ncbi:conserved protein, unknown function [Plasmodium yoelii]|uniref:Uncharacterized protein n=3 Tax=Plasmodium yoelii TaxID=5861 RepID=A0AAE9WM12_PLAYO|nr:conserved protein, unknown function [Plasmodium yoelii]EAA17818.1 hypothetical protein [Plasmodium yoelii yoelii]WBY56542.1 hypothetical protein Py17XNL_000801611 [Plasmodium yoelii yoelii]CDU17405.1 conserved Plasmodium protein, unknown function [Plasmodium yoelii]VTZ77086.1 conserved protein, unknown function [Plasmodium yoelii]|eukprot:XP_726253.1 conserved protein, unknown function [Plasmodium yoelii]
MNSIIKLLIPLVLFNVLCEGHPGGLGFNLKYNYSKYDNNNLNIFLKSNSPGCTGELERKIINGQKIDWSGVMVEDDTGKHNDNSIRIKINKSKEHTIELPVFDKKMPSNNFYKILFNCAKASSAKPHLIDICINKYFKKYNVPFSPDCVKCFSDFIGCGFISCNKQCSKDQCSNACRDCSQKECYNSLLKCTQLESLPDPCK